MSTTTTQTSLEVIHDIAPQHGLVDQLSELAAAAGYGHTPQEHLVALSELIQDKPYTEDEPQFDLKVGITEAFPNLRDGKPYEQAHLVLAGLGYIVGARRTEDAPAILTIRAKAMANLILAHEAGTVVDLSKALPRVIGLPVIEYV